jgi:hypothetical protein
VTTFTAAAFGNFAEAASNVAIAHRFPARALKDAILAAAMAEELEAIDIAACWDEDE